jgi:hypothetical protein
MDLLLAWARNKIAILVMKADKFLFLTVLSGFFAVNLAFAQTWNLANAGFTTKSVSVTASSADGNMLAAIIYPGPFTGGIYTSTNSGQTWVSNNVPAVKWSSIASSADGSKLAATINGGGIYITTNAGGMWSQTIAPTNYWSCIASSADGHLLAAAVGTNGSIYVSTNFGVAWTQSSAPTNYSWSSIASSADGSKLVAATGYPFGFYGIGNSGSTNAIYVSTNSGAAWIRTSSPSNIWISVASSADGNKLVAAIGYPQVGLIYTSTDSGTTWLSNSTPNAPGGWQLVASSADGVRLVAWECDTPIVSISTNSGTSWSSNYVNSLSSLGCLCAASSVDGNKLIAGTGGSSGFPYGGLYVYQTMPSPQLNLTPTNGSFKLSWLIPSTNFVMQQSSDLASWSNVTNAPVLNLTNLQNEVILSPSNSSSFYRLKTP